MFGSIQRIELVVVRRVGSNLFFSFLEEHFGGFVGRHSGPLVSKGQRRRYLGRPHHPKENLEELGIVGLISSLQIGQLNCFDQEPS